MENDSGAVSFPSVKGDRGRERFFVVVISAIDSGGSFDGFFDLVPVFFFLVADPFVEAPSETGSSFLSCFFFFFFFVFLDGFDLLLRLLSSTSTVDDFGFPLRLPEESRSIPSASTAGERGFDFLPLRLLLLLPPSSCSSSSMMMIAVGSVDFLLRLLASLCLCFFFFFFFFFDDREEDAVRSDRVVAVRSLAVTVV